MLIDKKGTSGYNGDRFSRRVQPGARIIAQRRGIA
jgi:hypothetical protein